MQILCKKGQLDLRIISVFDRLGGCQVFSRADSFGHTPLHSAMRQETSMEAIRALIQAYPEGLHTRTMYGDTPLSLACMRHLSPPIVCEVACASFCARDLQNVDPHRLSPLFLRNRAGQSPMSIVMEEFRQANISSSKKSCSFTSAATPDLIHAFDILASLVKILHYGPNRSSNFHENLVIACLALHRHEVRLDPAFILRAILKNPAEATTFDQDQNYPLHVEASIPVEKMILLDSQCQWCGDACHKRLQVLHTLMDIYPNAAKHRNKDGAFPLGIMINNGRLWDKAFALTVRACPEAIHEVDNIPRGMVPHVLYQISNGCGADTLYMLIRSRLEILY